MARVREKAYRGDISWMRMAKGEYRWLDAPGRIHVLRAQPLGGSQVFRYIFKTLCENISTFSISGGCSLRISAQFCIFGNLR